MLSAIKTERKPGNENFKEVKDTTLSNYWSWAHSDLIGNADRGILAEYIISIALDVHHGTIFNLNFFLLSLPMLKLLSI
jgi:hypothetical protein